VCSLLFAASGLASALPRTFNAFLVARFMSGAAIGISSMICPVYIAEMAPKEWRGRLGSMFQFGIVAGIFFTLLINAQIQSLGNEIWNTARGWRWMFAAEAAPSVLLLMAVVFAEESPRWLIQVGRELQASLIFKKIGGEAFAVSEVEAVKQASDQETGHLSELFTNRFRRPLIIAMALMVFSQFSGINAIMYYSTKIFTAAGIGLKNSFAATTLVGLVNFLFTLVAVALVDKAGRRALLLVGLMAQVCALTAVGWMFHAGIQGVVLVAAVVSFIAAFAMALGPIPWILSSEIFPNRVRGRAMSVATFVIWTSCYIVAQTFPMLNDNPYIGPAPTFWIYAACSFLGFVFVLAVVPETKGKSLEQIEMSWLKHSRR
jgi:SP family arabinose:H+ symporter-like MFS transporter